ncbi:hypothetical protein BDW59DRAFT_156018 [Aspergillus cavernicola]|uniref:P-loop containing nucleoside triphosphate hydrolase protein n=1 Tax=Aspergillus cavernicola TaxID=176166 RepID=A0ABR4J566_9EURO
MGKTTIIALSGPSSSGKTTLARLLQRVFSNQPMSKDQVPSRSSISLSTFIIHEDDFYHPDNKIPYTTTKSSQLIQDWDCLGALDIPFLSSALRYVHAHGHLPPRLRSKEDLNEVLPGEGEGVVGEELVRELRGRISRFFWDAVGYDGVGSGMGGGGEWTLALLEGFLLYAPPVVDSQDGREGEGEGHGLRAVHAEIDVRLFLPAPYELVKGRREKRSGYVTIGPAPTPELPQRSSASALALASEIGEGEEVDLHAEDDRPPQNFWTDPPGYVDDVVWPRYVRDHAWLLLPENEESEELSSIEDTDELIRKVGQGVNLKTDAGVTVAPGQGTLPMADLLKWAVEEVLKHLEQSRRTQ